MSEFGIGQIRSAVETGNTQELFQKSASESRLSTSDMASSGLSNSSPESFSGILQNAVDSVNKTQTEADTAIKELVSGRNKNIHEALLAVEKADSSLKLMMQVRNKILDAYKEVMRMQV